MRQFLSLLAPAALEWFEHLTATDSQVSTREVGSLRACCSAGVAASAGTMLMASRGDSLSRFNPLHARPSASQGLSSAFSRCALESQTDPTCPSQDLPGCSQLSQDVPG